MSRRNTIPAHHRAAIAAAITGEILYVDNGFSTVGMSFPLESGEG